MTTRDNFRECAKIELEYTKASSFEYWSNSSVELKEAWRLLGRLAAVNGMMRAPVEGPSIGVLLCESRSDPVVEFALETINQPIGVSTYRELPAPMREELPTVEDLPEVVNELQSEMESLRKEVPDEEKTISYRSETRDSFSRSIWQ